MKLPSLREMLEAGVHYGHTRGHSQPGSRSFIFTLRDNVYVIDLEKTTKKLQEAIEFLNNLAEEDKIILFVGTKKQSKELLEKIAKFFNMPYITNRWTGGMLTNFETLLLNLKRLEELDKYIESEDFEKLTKKQKNRFKENSQRLHQILDGVKGLKRLPDAIFIVDPAKENIALQEANKLNIPVIALCDTNSDPSKIDYPIFANDDSQKSLSLILNAILNNLTSKVKKTSEKKNAKSRAN